MTKIQAQQTVVDIKGSPEISSGLKDSLRLPRQAELESIQKTFDTITDLLERFGYIEAELQHIRKASDSLYIGHYNLGHKYEFLKINYNPKEFSEKQIKSVIGKTDKNSFTVPITNLEEILYTLTAIKNREGFAFAKVRLSEIEVQNADTLQAELLVSRNNFRTIDSIVIKGYEKFPKAFLSYYAGIRKGNKFDQQTITQQNTRLNNLPFASSLKSPEVLFREEKTSVYLYLQKENNNVFDGVVGFATEEETQKLLFNGYVNLELNNNFNYGEQFLLNYRADGKEQLEFRTRLKLPFIFRSRFGLSGELNIFKRDSSFVTTNQQLKTTYQISPLIQLFSGYRATTSANLLDESLAGQAIESYNSKFWTGGVSVTLPQEDNLFPIASDFQVEFGIGSRKKEGSLDSQWRIENDFRHIFNLNPANSVYLRVQGAYLRSDSYLTNELFRFGGSNSIRGFAENSIDASLFATINLEYRYRLNSGLFVHTVTDAGYFENPVQSLKHNLYGFGFGLGLQTRPGLFRFILANGLTEGRKAEFSNSKIHISLSSRF